MSKRETYELKTEEFVTPIVEKNNLDLWDVEFVKEGGEYYLRIYIDKDGGVTIEDCELVSRAMSEILDENDYIEEAYILEVSSPGLTRTLKKDKEFTKSIGRLVEVKLFKAIDKQKEFVGNLKSFDDKSVTITIDEEDRTFNKSDIATVKLTFEF